MKRLLPTSTLAALLGLAVFVGNAWGQAYEASMPDRVRHETVAMQKTASDKAKIWGVEIDEWKEYEIVMRGPYGLWYRDINPVWVLGFAARTDAERMRYAKLAAEIEERRVEAELAFQRAYDAAWREKNRNAKTLDPIRLTLRKKQHRDKHHRTPLQSAVSARRLVFVEMSCGICKAEVKMQLSTARDGGVDIYVVGAATDNDIRRWAKDLNIATDLVTQRVVTLNHDRGYFRRLTGEPLQGVRVLIEQPGHDAMEALLR